MKTNRDNTNKKDIINNVLDKTGLPSVYIAKIVDEIISNLVSNIYTKKTFKILNFGTFSLIRKKKRIGRNPKSKIGHEISERNVVTFRPAENLKKRINTNARKNK